MNHVSSKKYQVYLMLRTQRPWQVYSLSKLTRFGAGRCDGLDMEYLAKNNILLF